MVFGTNKNKLALLFFDKPALPVPQNASADQVLQKKIVLEMSDEDMALLDKADLEIQHIKGKHDFLNLRTFLNSLDKTFPLIDGWEDMDAEALSRAFSQVAVSGFFKQTDFMTRLNLLNHRDDAFILRFEKIVMVSLAAQPRKKDAVGGGAEAGRGGGGGDGEW